LLNVFRGPPLGVPMLPVSSLFAILTIVTPLCRTRICCGSLVDPLVHGNPAECQAAQAEGSGHARTDICFVHSKDSQAFLQSIVTRKIAGLSDLTKRSPATSSRSNEMWAAPVAPSSIDRVIETEGTTTTVTEALVSTTVFPSISNVSNGTAIESATMQRRMARYETTTEPPATLRPLPAHMSKAQQARFNRTRRQIGKDCQLADWSDWSECLQEHDGYVGRFSQKTRDILDRGKPGGKPCLIIDTLMRRECPPEE